MVMNLAGRGVEGIPLLGRYNHTNAMPGLKVHAHARAIEICFLVKGRQSYLLGRRVYRLRGGDVFIAFPGEKHSTGGLPQEKGVLYWMAVRGAPDGGRFLGLPARQGRSLWRALLGIKTRHFRGSWKMKEHLDAVTGLFQRRSGPLDAVAMTNHAVAFLLDVIASARAGRDRRNHAISLQPVLDHVERHLGEPLPVPGLAAMAGMSVARFKVRFKQELGVPPGEYVLRARVAEAERRLREEKSTITEIAYGLGFSTSQYFATVFQRFTGRTPSAFRKAHSGAGEER